MTNFSCLAAADPPAAQRADTTDDDHEPDRPMDFNEERDFADQGPLTEMDIEEDTENTNVHSHNEKKGQLGECGIYIQVYSRRPNSIWEVT